MFQRWPDSHMAIRSHIAALARLIPAPEVLPALRGALDEDDDDVALGLALVPTSTTRATGALVTFSARTFSALTLPSGEVYSVVTSLLPSTPLVSVLVCPL